MKGLARTRRRAASVDRASTLVSLCVLGTLLSFIAPPVRAQLATMPGQAFQFSGAEAGAANGPTPPQHYESSLGAAWSDAQSWVNGCVGGPSYQCYTALNLHATTQTTTWPVLDGMPTAYQFDIKSCSVNNPNQCTTNANWGTILAPAQCPGGAGPTTKTPLNPTNNLSWCPVSLPPQPAPFCLLCSLLGNPIDAASGQKVQSETDYSVGPLTYTRTYRSNTANPSAGHVAAGGSFGADTQAGFFDFSQTTMLPYSACVPGFIKATNPGGSTYSVGNCFPYIGFGATSSQYAVATAGGRYIQFSGQPGAITEKADVNDRLTQITVNGTTEWQVNRDDDSTEIYSTSGARLQRTLRGGLVLTYTYSTSSTPSNIAPWPGLLLTETDPFGHVLSFQYNAQGMVSQMTDPAGGVYQYVYDTYGNQTSVIYPDNSSKTYSYNESADTGGANLPSALTGITDESGVRYATFKYYAYLENAYATNTQHAGGVDSYTVTYDANAYYNNPITSAVIVDPLGASRTYNFSQNVSYNYSTSQIQPAASGSGNVTQSLGYDSNSNPTTFTDYNGNITKRVYNQARNLETSRTEAYGTSSVRTITTVWDANWRQPDLISLYNNSTGTGTPIKTTAFTYDSNGNVLTKTITDTTASPNISREWQYTYDTYGRMLTAKGPRTDVNSTTTYAYYTCTTGYQCGELQTVTDPVGNVTTYNTYNADGQPLTITDPNAVVTTLTYDARTRLTSRQVGTETTSFSYYPTGLLKQVTLPDSSYVLYTYDGAHRLTQISDGAGNSIQYTLDNAGNRTAEKTYDPSNNLHRAHTRVFNSLNQLYQDINAANTSAVTTTYSYDNDANQTASAAPLSRNTANVFDQLNRISQITDPNNGKTYFGYDAADDLTSVKDPRSLTTSYTYNGFGDVTKLVSPDTGTTTSTYDSGGNLSTSTDARGAVSTYTYDVANRVTSIAYSLSGTTDQTLAFGYDSGTNGKGRLTSASDANHSLAWTYDSLGRVVGKGLTVGTTNLSIGYGYTSGDMTSLVTPSGQSVTYGFNSNHQVTSVAVNGATVLSGVTYEPFGGVNGWTWGDSSTVSRTFNGDGLVSQIATAGVTLGYSFDNANRITGISDSSNSALTWTYGYDLLDRLSSATTTAITDGWTFDANGNPLTQTGTTPITFSVNSTNNQLSATTGSLVRSYSYDAAGHVTGYGTNGFTYNDRGRVAATVASSTDYLYNALGQMIEKSGTLGTTIFMQDEAGHLIGEYNGSGGLVEETIWLGDIPVATLQPNGSGGVNIYYVHTDHLNTPRKIAQPSTGTLAWRWDADPFGTTAPNQNPGGLGTFVYNLRAPGQYYQAETGLNQNWFRDYDPAVGRYVEPDPLGQRAYFDFYKLTGLTQQRGYWNRLYAYVDDNPVMHRDPRGLLPDWLQWFSDFFNDKAPEVATSNIVGTGLSAICIAKNCGKTRNDLELLGDCTSYMAEWAEQHPEIIGAIGGITSDGAAAAIGDCQELCAKGIRSGKCCKKGSQ